MPSNKTVICRYQHCQHETRELLRDEAVRDGRSYYHKDCFATREAMQKIVEFYVENFDKDPIFAQLKKICNELVFKKGYSPEYVLFTLQYAKKKSYNLHSPIGMYYLAKDYKIREAWEQHKLETAASKIVDYEFDIQNSYEKVEGYNVSKNEGFGRVIK